MRPMRGRPDTPPSLWIWMMSVTSPASGLRSPNITDTLIMVSGGSCVSRKSEINKHNEALNPPATPHLSSLSPFAGREE